MRVEAEGEGLGGGGGSLRSGRVTARPVAARGRRPGRGARQRLAVYLAERAAAPSSRRLTAQMELLDDAVAADGGGDGGGVYESARG